MRSTVAALFAWGLGGAVVPACNGGDSGVSSALPDAGGNGSPDAAAGPPDMLVAIPAPPAAVVESVCAAYAAAQCARFSECLPFYLGILYGTSDVCLGREKLKCSLRLASEGTRLGAEFMAGCTQSVTQAACPAVVANRISGAEFPGCVAPAGTVGNGRPCGVDDQCASGYCRRNGACGVCAVRSPPGRLCEVRGDCQPGSVCQNGVCIIPSAQGETCGSDASCIGDLSCIQGKCLPPLGPKSGCDPDNDKCALFAGFLCHPDTMVCETIALVDAGRPCGFLGGGQVALCKGGYCDVGLFEQTGTCVAPAADGEMCGGGNGECVDPSFCSGAGVCALPSPNTCL